MGYSTFSTAPKNLTKAEDIGNGQIELRHLAPSLFAEIQKVGLHNHTGVGSRKVRQDMLEGAYGKNGFILYSDDGTKRYRITINNSGTLQATEV
jgi:hypothetical protein